MPVCVQPRLERAHACGHKHSLLCVHTVLRLAEWYLGVVVSERTVRRCSCCSIEKRNKPAHKERAGDPRAAVTFGPLQPTPSTHQHTLLSLEQLLGILAQLDDLISLQIVGESRQMN